MIRLLKYAASAALLGLALWLLDWSALRRSIALLNPGLMCGLLGLCLLSYCIMALRWQIMVQPIAPRRALEHLRIYLYANLLNSLTPANLGGDAYRVMQLKAETGTTRVLVVVVQERIYGLLGYLGLYLGCWLAAKTGGDGAHAALRGLFAWVAVGSAGALAGALALVLLRGGLERRLSALETRLPRLALVLRAALCMDAGVFARALALSLLATAVWVSVYWLAARGLNLPLSWPELGMLAILVELVRLVPLSVQGIGVRESAAGFFAATLGAGYEAGFLMAAVCYLLNSVAMLLTGCVGAGMARRGSRNDTPPETSGH